MNNFENISYTDIKNQVEFPFEGSVLKQSEYCPQTGRYLYKRYYGKSAGIEYQGKLMGYEVVQPIKRKNPDGSIVLCYPPTTQFGSKGWYLPGLQARRIWITIYGD